MSEESPLFGLEEILRLNLRGDLHEARPRAEELVDGTREPRPSPGTVAHVEPTHSGASCGRWPQRDLRGLHMGRYLVLGMLGRGGMGVVVEAYDEALDRSVALKLINPSTVRRNELRLLREAQALARLSHPNVVQVYDIGELDDQPFIAMELVRGQTLRTWGRERRPWRSAVAVYLQAARGLAAAHEKGLVHRDFKPENCIIDDAGRVRVLDFGLARELSSPLSAEPTSGARSETASHVLGESLTCSGVLMGTLRYMAFEQLQGHPADAHSDQYSFCVSLYEALHGVAPYAGKSVSSLLTAMFADIRQPTPPGAAMPRRLSRALWRGLSKNPAHRWPSMDALIHELEALSSARWTRSVTVALGASLSLAAGVALVGDDPCPDVATALADTWDADAQRSVEQAFAAHGTADATVLPRVVDRLDDYATAWATMTRESCRATFVVRRQSEAQLEHRTRCLERRRNQLVATISALADAENASELTEAVVLPFRLPPLTPCAETTDEALDAATNEAPRDERHARVRRDIDEAHVLREAGRHFKGAVRAEAALAAARALDDRALMAEALECLGRLQAEYGWGDRASATLEEAIVVANEARDDASAARAWLSLLFATTTEGEHARAEHYGLGATAAVARSGDEVLHAWLLNNLGILATEQGDFERAREQFERALALKQTMLGTDHIDLGITWLNLANLRAKAGDHAGAADALGRARAIFVATVGEAHPLNANVATLSWNIGLREDAHDIVRRALEVTDSDDVEQTRQWTSWLEAHEEAPRPVPIQWR